MIVQFLETGVLIKYPENNSDQLHSMQVAPNLVLVAISKPKAGDKVALVNRLIDGLWVTKKAREKRYLRR